ncbi:MAG: class I SAM-dependent methyltransferase [Phaeodactylibacter sp.]|nr:class I SAM-dependent methyltransferase [Phaeodactylibacter sp.]
MQTLQVSTVPAISTSIQNLFNNNGPVSAEYDSIIQMADTLAGELKTGALSEEDLEQVRSQFSADYLEKTMHGHSFSKPYGYAGDFMIIDKVYRKQICTEYQKWDEFFHDVKATRAVRNRKDYFKAALRIASRNKAQVQLLNLASGPARDLYEFYQENPAIDLRTDCIEYDQQAIAFAKDLTKDYQDKINFIQGNVLRFQPEKPYDVVWSAGLFDYFNDEIFVKILNRAMSWATSEVIIGNFTPDNPSRNFMEVLLDWHLYHRDEAHLTELALKAGAQPHQIQIGQEKEGVNLFLHIKLQD